MRRMRGLTLIEMLVTLTVLGILSVLAYPSMMEFVDKHRVTRMVKAVAELAELARSEAMKRSGLGTQKSVTLTVNPGTGSDWFVGLRHGTEGCATSLNDCVLNQGGESVPQRVSAADGAGVTMTQPVDAAALVRFDFRGLVTGAGGSQMVTLRSPRGRHLQLEISPIGTVSVCSPGGEVTGYPACS